MGGTETPRSFGALTPPPFIRYLLRHLPNALTCAHLTCGCAGIVATFAGDLPRAAWFIALAALFDFADGLAARLLRAHSSLGQQLDSLADCVSFGALPAFIAFHYLRLVLPPGHPAAYLAFSIAVFSALRLAKFNVDTRQTDAFIGLPTPANALLWAALPLILRDYPAVAPYLLTPWFLAGLTGLMSFLLVAELPLFALKFKHWRWPGNQTRYSFLILSVGLFAALRFASVPFILLLYIGLSLTRKASI